MAKFVRRGGKKNRKHGRNKIWCAAYRGRGQRWKNKAKRLRRHLRRFPDDKIAESRLQAGG